MSNADIPGGHDHFFLGDDHDRNARRVWLVIALTTTMMVAEIAAGTIYGSMALLADGWHMATHATALLISAVAYRIAKRHSRNPRFSFGTGKVGDLGAFASAVGLFVVAILIGWESVNRLAQPEPIAFGEAIGVAVVGLIVNLVSAWLLRADDSHAKSSHHHGHGSGESGHHHRHHHHGHQRDNNLRAAYLHVLADALTSVLAIVALVVGASLGWLWADAVIGLLGALVIARWSIGLLRDSGSVLVDYLPADQDLPARIISAVEDKDTRIIDLHVWRVGPGHHAVIVALAAGNPQPVAEYRRRLAALEGLSHVTVEVHSEAASTAAAAVPARSA